MSCHCRTCHRRIISRLQRQRSLLERGTSQPAQTGLTTHVVLLHTLKVILSANMHLVKHMTCT
jgi:hypothetical protein